MLTQYSNGNGYHFTKYVQQVMEKIIVSPDLTVRVSHKLTNKEDTCFHETYIL